MSQITETIHSLPVDPQTGAIAVPIYQTSTFVQEAPGIHKGFDYARTNNPTRKVLSNVLASITKERNHRGSARIQARQRPSLATNA